jgi:hypothetical protein
MQRPVHLNLGLWRWAVGDMRFSDIASVGQSWAQHPFCVGDVRWPSNAKFRWSGGMFQVRSVARQLGLLCCPREAGHGSAHCRQRASQISVGDWWRKPNLVPLPRGIERSRRVFLDIDIDCRGAQRIWKPRMERMCSDQWLVLHMGQHIRHNAPAKCEPHIGDHQTVLLG